MCFHTQQEKFSGQRAVDQVLQSEIGVVESKLIVDLTVYSLPDCHQIGSHDFRFKTVHKKRLPLRNTILCLLCVMNDSLK